MAIRQPSATIRRAVTAKYARAAECVRGLFRYPTGAAGARGLGYPPGFIADAPPEILESFCGVGNPFSLGPIREGEAALDIGCGAGFDLYCATRLAGRRGKVVGLDLTPEMVAKARKSLGEIAASNVDVVNGNVESLPFANGVFDIILSNAALNLSVEKARAFAEIFRVLKPGGRVQAADILRRDEPPPGKLSAESWSD